jgi:hypothetical protein
LLAPLYTIGLDRLTTEVNFTEVRLQGMAMPLWQPREVSLRIFHESVFLRECGLLRANMRMGITMPATSGSA